MKLVTKISAAAVFLLLLFSQIFSGWMLYRMREQRIESVLEYERDNMYQRKDEFHSRWIARQIGNSSLEEAYWGRENCIQCFGEDTVLYYKGKEILNSTPYVFELENMTDTSQYPLDAAQGYDQNMTFLEKAGDKKLLIMLSRVQDFQMIHFEDITSIFTEAERLFYKGLAAAAILSVILMAVLRQIIGKILMPFYRLRDAANVIAQGNYEERIPVEKKDEISEISASFNQMAQRVEAHIQELKKINEKQRQLMGSLAHELKTPMTAIQGYAETLQRICLPKEKQEKALAYIEKECKRLSRLSAKMLELTELSEENCQIEKKPVSVSELIQEVERLTYYRLKEKDIHLEIQNKEDTEITGDKDLLISALMNLVDNACKASQPGGRIKIYSEKEGIYVQDWGSGIPKEECGRITEPFYMVDKSRARKEGGAGLGLALSSQVARLHGGWIEVRSELGKGSTIGIVWETTA